MINTPVKLWERKPYIRFENPTNIIYPCLLYLPIIDVIGQDKNETTIWDCNAHKWVKKISYDRYKLVFNVYGRKFSCIVRNKYKIGDMQFVHLSEGFHNNGELRLASMKDLLEYELKKYKSLQVRILSVKDCNLRTENCYCKADMQFLSRYTSETLKINDVKFIGYMSIKDIPLNTVGIEISSAPFDRIYRGFWLGINDILCFYVNSFRNTDRSIRTNSPKSNNDLDFWFLCNSNKIFLTLIIITLIILFLIYTI